MSELLELSKALFAALGDTKDEKRVVKARDVCALEQILRKFEVSSDGIFDVLFLILASVRIPQIAWIS